MADFYGNYQAGLVSLDKPNTVFVGGTSIQVGTGAPTANTPTVPNAYVDSVTLKEYVYYNGSWHAVSGSGGGGAASQVMGYTTTDPNTDGILPPDQTQPAIAVKPNSSIFTWTTPSGPWV